MKEEEVRRAYARLERIWKTPAARLGMGSPTIQRKSFKQTLDFTEQFYTLTGRSIHDAGCGHGALYPLAKQRGISSYIGSELREEVVAEGNILFPEAKKEVRNLLTDELPKADITFLMGVLAGWDCDSSLRMIERALGASNLAVVFYHWFDTPPNSNNYEEAMLLQEAVDTILQVNPNHTAKGMLQLSTNGDRLIIISHKPLV